MSVIQRVAKFLLLSDAKLTVKFEPRPGSDTFSPPPPVLSSHPGCVSAALFRMLLLQSEAKLLVLKVTKKSLRKWFSPNLTLAQQRSATLKVIIEQQL